MMNDRRMILSVVAVFLAQCCWSEELGCNTWVPYGDEDDVCCQRCNEGYRITKSCGPNLRELCTPCEDGTFTLDPSKKSCTKCKQCGGIQTTVAPCSRTRDTQCGCPPQRFCNNAQCTACLAECGPGREPESGTCRPCPKGTFNDQKHQKCKPLTSKNIEAPPTASITATAAMRTTTPTTAEGEAMLPWWVLIAASGVTVLIPLALMIKVVQRHKGSKTGKPNTNTQQKPLVTTPTDEPRTLMAIECSFHEPEQVSSSDSLATEESEGSTSKFIV